MISPDFIVNVTFMVYVVGVFFALITVLATDTHKELSDFDISVKLLILSSLSWIIVVAILMPKIVRLYKHKW